jgi:hypothetical protein
MAMVWWPKQRGNRSAHGATKITRMDNLTAYRLANELVLSAGFQFSHAGIGEDCWYFHPAHGPERLLRLSTSKHKKLPYVSATNCAHAYFTANHHHTQTKVTGKVATAIGRYFLWTPAPRCWRRDMQAGLTAGVARR